MGFLLLVILLMLLGPVLFRPYRRWRGPRMGPWMGPRPFMHPRRRWWRRHHW